MKTASELGCLPCPCCGEARDAGFTDAVEPFGLAAHRDSGDTSAVVCYSCGTRNVQRFPDEWPPETPPEVRSRAALAWLAEWNLARAIAAWNRRPETLR